MIQMIIIKTSLTSQPMTDETQTIDLLTNDDYRLILVDRFCRGDKIFNIDVNILKNKYQLHLPLYSKTKYVICEK